MRAQSKLWQSSYSGITNITEKKSVLCQINCTIKCTVPKDAVVLSSQMGQNKTEFLYRTYT